MIACTAHPRDVVVDICILSRCCSLPGPRPSGLHAAWNDDEDDGDEDDFEMPYPDDDPDWGLGDEEAEPEKGDFWFDSDDEEDAL